MIERYSDEMNPKEGRGVRKKDPRITHCNEATNDRERESVKNASAKIIGLTANALRKKERNDYASAGMEVEHQCANRNRESVVTDKASAETEVEYQCASTRIRESVAIDASAEIEVGGTGEVIRCTNWPPTSDVFEVHERDRESN